MLKILRLISIASIFTFLLTDCGSNSSNTSQKAINANITANFSSIYTNVLSQNCTQCHVPGTPTYTNNLVHLDFTSATTAYTTLKGNVSGATSIGTCGGIAEVDPNSAANSYLAGVLFSDYHINNFAGVSGCTPYANHLQDFSFSAEEENAIVSWINAGALNN